MSMIDTSELNQYGLQLLQTWQRLRPHAVLEMTDPTDFFQQLGEQVAEQIQQRRIELAPEATGPDFQENVAMLETARYEAESQVMREVLQEYLSPEHEEDTQD